MFDKQRLTDMELQLSIMADMIEDNDISCEVFPADGQYPIPTLLVQFPGDEHGALFILVNFLPLPEGEDYTRFVQFYIELPYDLSWYDEAALFKEIDTLNRQLPLGHCVTLEKRDDMKYARMIGVRYVHAIPRAQEIDGGTLLETLQLFTLSCDAVEEHFLGSSE